MIDLVKTKEYFEKYISDYDINNSKINLKIIHMHHVAENARKIAKMLGLSKEEQNLAELIGLLHDIGRFEQVKWYNTFSDKVSVDHASKGLEVLFADKHIRHFIVDDKCDTIIYKAINNHNKFEIEKGLSKYESLFCKIIRDADNLDIFRCLLEDRLEDLGHFGTENISNEILSPEFFEDFKKEKPLLYVKAKTDMDIMVAIIAHIYTINFNETLEIIKEKDYINKFVKRLNAQDSYTKQKMNEIANYAMNYITKNINKYKRRKEK